MTEKDLQIDESKHKRIPTFTERLISALLGMFFSFLLIQLIAFWMFPGVGIGGFYLFSSAHSKVAFVGNLTNIIVITFVAVCGVMGWFQGKYFTDWLKGYLSYWKFW